MYLIGGALEFTFCQYSSGAKGTEKQGGMMASVVRVSHGGGAVVEESHLTIEQARSVARSLANVGEPAGCCWCVGLWDDEEEEVAGESPC
jgi:hypothetical protein